MFNEGSIKVILGLIINKFFIYKSIFFSNKTFFNHFKSMIIRVQQVIIFTIKKILLLRRIF